MRKERLIKKAAARGAATCGTIEVSHRREDLHVEILAQLQQGEIGQIFSAATKTQEGSVRLSHRQLAYCPGSQVGNWTYEPEFHYDQAHLQWKKAVFVLNTLPIDGPGNVINGHPTGRVFYDNDSVIGAVCREAGIEPEWLTQWLKED